MRAILGSRSGYVQPLRSGAKKHQAADKEYAYEYESMRARVFSDGDRFYAGNMAHGLRQVFVLPKPVRQKFLLFATQKVRRYGKKFALHTKMARGLSGAKHS
jgi:hypothetical protein